MTKVLSFCFSALLFVVSSIIVASCNDGAPTDKKAESSLSQETTFVVTEVEGYDIIFNDTEAGAMINFKSDEIEHCSLVFVKSKFVQGYSARITALGEGDMDLTCLMRDHHYAMTDSGDSYVQLNIEELGDKAVLKLSFSLYSVRAKMKLVKENIALVVNNKQLKTMVDKR